MSRARALHNLFGLSSLIFVLSLVASGTTACGGGDEETAVADASRSGAARFSAAPIDAESADAGDDSEGGSGSGSGGGSHLWQGTVAVVASETPQPADSGEATPNTLQMTMDALMAKAPTNTVEATVGPTKRPTRTPRPPRALSGGSTGGSSGGSSSRQAASNTPESPDRATNTPDHGGDATSGPNLPNETAPPTGPQPTSGPSQDHSVLGQLRGGGLVIYLRHTRTDWDQSSRELEWVEEVKQDMGNRSLYDQCDRQRLLNGEGKDQARAIGDTFRRLGIPVGRVITSPWCRTRETARLAFGGGSDDLDKVWDTGYLSNGSSERKHYKEALRGLLSSSPGGGSNTVIVGHMPQLQDATGIALQEAEAAIFRPEGGYKLLEKNVAPGEWDGLANR